MVGPASCRPRCLRPHPDPRRHPASSGRPLARGRAGGGCGLGSGPAGLRVAALLAVVRADRVFRLIPARSWPVPSQAVGRAGRARLRLCATVTPHGGGPAAGRLRPRAPAQQGAGRGPSLAGRGRPPPDRQPGITGRPPRRARPVAAPGRSLAAAAHTPLHRSGSELAAGRCPASLRVMVALAGSPNSHRGTARPARGFSGGPSSRKSNPHRGLYGQKRGFTEGDHYIDELIGYTRTRPGKAAERFFAHANHLYSVAAITNASGSLVERSKYDAYGKRSLTNSVGASIATSTVGNATAFTGRSVDGETGLMYFRARMYAPTQGRFVSQDPWVKTSIYPSAGDHYRDGWGLYLAYFVPNMMDPEGTGCCTWGNCSGMPSSCGGGGGTGGGTGATYPPLGPPSYCQTMAALFRASLTTTEELRAWDNYAGGSGRDIRLTTEEMENIIGSNNSIPREITAYKNKCRNICDSQRGRSGFYEVTSHVGMAPAPWIYAIGGYDVTMRYDCTCCCYMGGSGITAGRRFGYKFNWSGSLNDVYDFNPIWQNTHRTFAGEWGTRAVWGADLLGLCGWKQFSHRGKAYGSEGSCPN